jgi:hypothetical protein
MDVILGPALRLQYKKALCQETTKLLPVRCETRGEARDEMYMYEQ